MKRRAQEGSPEPVEAGAAAAASIPLDQVLDQAAASPAAAILNGCLPSDSSLVSTLALLVKSLRSEHPGAVARAAEALARVCEEDFDRALQVQSVAGALAALAGALRLEAAAPFAAKVVHSITSSYWDWDMVPVVEKVEGLVPALVAALGVRDAVGWAAQVLGCYCGSCRTPALLRVAQTEGFIPTFWRHCCMKQLATTRPWPS